MKSELRSQIPMEGLIRSSANYVPLSPISFLKRSALVYRDRTSVVYGDVRYTWKDTLERCTKLASALAQLGISRGDVISVNFEQHLDGSLKTYLGFETWRFTLKVDVGGGGWWQWVSKGGWWLGGGGCGNGGLAVFDVVCCGESGFGRGFWFWLGGGSGLAMSDGVCCGESGFCSGFFMVGVGLAVVADGSGCNSGFWFLQWLFDDRWWLAGV
nr:putative acyl-activating enzyme 1, peroxisomal [Quercus suber]